MSNTNLPKQQRKVQQVNFFSGNNNSDTTERVNWEVVELTETICFIWQLVDPTYNAGGKCLPLSHGYPRGFSWEELNRGGSLLPAFAQ